MQKQKEVADDLMCGNDILPEAPPFSMVRMSFCALGVNSIIILVSSLYHPRQSFIFSKSQGQNSLVPCQVIGGCES